MSGLRCHNRNGLAASRARIGTRASREKNRDDVLMASPSGQWKSSIAASIGLSRSGTGGQQCLDRERRSCQCRDHDDRRSAAGRRIGIRTARQE
jgi:hypothetical protein